MSWILSTALAQSLQILWEPWVTDAELTADANWMRRVPSAPPERPEGLGKADNHMTSERESYLNSIFGCETHAASQG